MVLRQTIPTGRAFYVWAVTLAGFAIAFAGCALEFWGAWLLGEPIAGSAATRGSEAWWGFDAGWMLFVLGLVVLSGGGPPQRWGFAASWPMWACTFVAVLGIGVMLANILHEAPAAPALVGLGAFGTGWLALAAWLWRRG